VAIIGKKSGAGHVGGNDSVWQLLVKSNPMVEPRGERCCSSKESRLQGLAAEQSCYLPCLCGAHRRESPHLLTVKKTKM